MEQETGSDSPRSNLSGETRPQEYEIKVQGVREPGFWADWFGDLAFSVDHERAETTLRGPVADQAALYGLLSRLRNAGLTLIAARQIRQEPDCNQERPASV